MEKIPFKRINLGKAYEEVKPLFDSGFIGLGNTVYEFEKELAKYVNAPFVVTTDSCTSAIFLSLKYISEREMSPHLVDIPSMTVPLVVNACFEAGYQPRFNGETDWVGSAYSLVGTDVIDSAHQLQRGQYKGGKMCFSFYPTKTIGSADGGAIATDDEAFADWARSVSTYGRNQKAKYGNSWDYDVEMVGYKRHWTNLQAAIALEQLKRLDETNEKRQRIVAEYNAAFSLNNKSDYLYRIGMPDRDRFIKYALEKGIECGVHFKPLHLMTPFKDVLMTDEDKQRVEENYKMTVSLPLYDTLTDEEVERVIDAVNSFK